MANYGHRITDVNVYMPNKALAKIMLSPNMELFMGILTQEVVLRYRAKVAKKTGQLMESASATTPIGGHKHDRIVGKVTVGGQMAVSTWKGEPFYYGVLHNFGSPLKKGQFPAHDDLKDVMDTM